MIRIFVLTLNPTREPFIPVNLLCLTSQALLGAPDVSPQAAAANFSQLKRWVPEVMIMSSTARSVLFGLCKAQALAAEQLPAINVPLAPNPPPQPIGEY